MKAFLRFLAIAIVLVAPALAQDQKGKASPEPPAGVLYEKDVEFGTGAETTLKLDLARPEKVDRRLPCIVVIHGGGWRGGNFKVHVPEIFDFAKHGYVSATVQYRLVPAAQWPAQVEDVK